MNPRHLVIVVLVGTAGTSAAQPRKKAPITEEKRKADKLQKEAEEKKQKVAEHFERGVRAYNFGNYDDAIREYQAAFDLIGDPLYLFNIGQTYRTKGDKKLAHDFYKKYIEFAPDGEGVASARSHMEAIEKELRAEEKAAEERRKAEEEAARRRAAEAQTAKFAAAEAAKGEAVETVRRRVAEAEAAQRRKTARYFRIVGMSASGAGVATLGVASIFGLRARSLSREASATSGMWTQEAQRKVDGANSSEHTMFILLGVGATVAATGTVLYLIGWRKNETAQVDSKRISITPGLLPDGAALIVAGRF